MNTLLHKALKRGIVPLVLMTTLAFSMQLQKQAAQDVRSTFLAGIIASAVLAASPIYEYEKWSLKKQTVVHTLVMSLTVLPCLFFSGWYETQRLDGLLLLFASFIGSGLFFWSIGYLIFGKVLKK